MSDSIKFPRYIGYDRTILPAYGLPRQMNRDELDAVLEARGAKGKDLIEVTARPYERVLFSLGMKDEQLASVRGQRILVCGEGASTFGRTLEERGARVVAADRLYATPMSAMAKRHLIYEADGDYMVNLVTPCEMRGRLPKRIVGTELSSLPFADKSFDATFIPNVVYWYLDAGYRKTIGGHIETGFAIIDEALRVSSGYVHFNLAELKTLHSHADTLSRRYPHINVIVRPNANIRLERPQKQTTEPDVQSSGKSRR